MAIGKSLTFVVFIFVSPLVGYSSDEIRDRAALNTINSEINEISKVEKHLNNKVLGYSRVNQTSRVQDCGEDLLSGKYEIDEKVCQPGFAPGEYAKCVETCNETNVCQNGASCLKHVCVCLPGTSGPYCGTIDLCEGNQLCVETDQTSCKYDTERQKAYCYCHVEEYRFDDTSKTCNECACVFFERYDPKATSDCQFTQGEKICTCGENYSYNSQSQICAKCDCGRFSNWCQYDNNGHQICNCKKGYIQIGLACEKDDCGEHGLTKISAGKGKQIDCICDPGYEAYNHTCIECSCGKYGKCVFDSEDKQVACNCQTRYSEKSGMCEMCYCGENSKCTFRGNLKVCECGEGYENVGGFCADINECHKHNPCPISAKCINTIGSYKCPCADGYITRVEGSMLEVCEDINECENPSTCHEENTECLNTPGSFACICKSGFIYRGEERSSTFCEKNTDWSIYGIVIATSFVALIFAIGSVLFLRRKFQRDTRSSFHELH